MGAHALWLTAFRSVIQFQALLMIWSRPLNRVRHPISFFARDASATSLGGSPARRVPSKTRTFRPVTVADFDHLTHRITYAGS